MSFLWIIRALNLLIILPRKSPVSLRYVYHLHLVTVILAYFSSNHTAPTNDLTHDHIASAIRFDQRIAAISLFMDASANALIAVSPTSSQALFVFLTSLNALTSGGHPALQSLGAVSLRAMGKGNEMGLVFGALGVANAVSHIVAVRLHPMLHHTRTASLIFMRSSVHSLAHTRQSMAPRSRLSPRRCSSQAPFCCTSRFLSWPAFDQIFISLQRSSRVLLPSRHLKKSRTQEKDHTCTSGIDHVVVSPRLMRCEGSQ